MKKAFTLILAICILMSGCVKDQADPKDLASPQYEVSDVDSGEAPSEEEIHTAEEGLITIMPEVAQGQDAAEALSDIPLSVLPETIWENDNVATYNSFTLPEKALLDVDDGSIGVLTIPAIGLSVNVYEAEDEMEAMKKGAAHFKSTTAYDGNVGISAHNINLDGSDGYFKNLHTLKINDTLTYETALGERSYKVSQIKEISESDWSYLGRSATNKVSLITCITGKPTKRLMVQAVEK